MAVRDKKRRDQSERTGPAGGAAAAPQPPALRTPGGSSFGVRVAPAGAGRARGQVWLPAISALTLAMLHALVRVAPDLLMPLGLLTMCGLAVVNGANDVSKGIATLVGAGVTDYRRAIRWGMFCTGIGAVAAALAARALVATFSTSLVAVHAHFDPVAALAVLLGALGWVFLATRAGLPVSTTHAITGAVVGIGVVSAGTGAIAWSTLVRKIALPLAASPLLAMVLGLAAFALVRAVPGRGPLRPLHWLSSGATSLARGLNDAPKIVALGAGFVLTNGSATVPFSLFLAVAAAMMLGSWVGGRRVTRTLAEHVTRLDDHEGLAANLATALLVSTASNLGLPVSTTHVSSGAIIGVGVRRGLGAVRWRTVGELVLAWLVTLPTAGLIAIVAFIAVR